MELSHEWTPHSWEGLPIHQQPEYRDKLLLAKVLQKLTELPEIVYPQEVEQLKVELASCARGEKFLIQCGDCAESFTDCSATKLDNKLKVMESFRDRMEEIIGKPVVLVGRIAGQYAKPRSEPYETVLSPTGQPIKVLSYKGDNINSMDIEKREPNPKRMLDGYYKSSATMNYIRMHYSQLEDRTMYVSHEGLLLAFEASMSRKFKDHYYNLGTHCVWLGERTRKLGSAHVEYFHGVRNPIGVKVGPNANLEELVEIMRQLNPLNEEGKLILIPRLGARNVRDQLPSVIRAVKNSGIHHVWEADPMHGNTYKTEDGIKTRKLSDLISELTDVIEVLREHDENLAGIHIETAADDVTECVGGTIDTVQEPDLFTKYTTQCDPRLNPLQADELISTIGRLL